MFRLTYKIAIIMQEDTEGKLYMCYTLPRFCQSGLIHQQIQENKRKVFVCNANIYFDR